MHTAYTDLVLPFSSVGMGDVDRVGGKNASLGEMISNLSQAGVCVPDGFATTAFAFTAFLQHNDLVVRIQDALANLNPDNIAQLNQVGAQIRAMILAADLPPDLQVSIRQHFQSMMCDTAGQPVCAVAVRSSATAEDLPDASFAGQQESYLNVVGINEVLDRVKHVYASLYNDRAISYRVHKGFAHADVAISVGVQRMVRSDTGAAGVMFTMDTESGFRDVVFITASYGLGETVVQGAVNPDEYYVHKPMLAAGNHALVRRSMGSKLIKMVLSEAHEVAELGRVKTVDVSLHDRNRYCLNPNEARKLAEYAVKIEQHYGRPMDIEWGKDGADNALYILQARPETVKSQENNQATVERHVLRGEGRVLATGRAIGQKIGAGTVRILHDISQMDTVQPGDVLVADMTDPNWEPVMKRASAIVTNRGGRTCHAAIIARELGIPAVVGCEDATAVLQAGTFVTVSCAEGDEGKIYEGLLETHIETQVRGHMPDLAVKMMMNVGTPNLAFDFCQIPNAGVGLARLEFIINSNIGVHPKAILEYPNVDDALKRAVESVARGHDSPQAFFVDKLSEGIATIAAAFWPKPVIVRLSDFKSNEYRKLIGGTRYEPEEENPMLGFRGAARYISPDFAACFALECAALKRVRSAAGNEGMGYSNVEIMVPFVRTLTEAKAVTEALAHQGLVRGENGLRLIMMCEVPSNAILAAQFLEYFDGFSIGSNDLTQLTLGIDRDSGIVAAGFDERDPAVKALITNAITACLAAGKYVGICGQGPSDYPDFALWLAQQNISSISLNPDSVVATWQTLAKSL